LDGDQEALNGPGMQALGAQRDRPRLGYGGDAWRRGL